jgi:hypothetical protein
MIVDTETYVGPARVIDVNPSTALLALAGREIQAHLALGSLYEPVPGDVVLVLGHGDNYYVIGVLQGRGPTRIHVQGDLELRAPRGRIELFAGREIQFRTPRLALKVMSFELVARKVVERVGSIVQRVKDAVQLRAGRTSTTIDGDCHLRAKRVVTLASGEVRLDGSRIDLG